MATLYGARDRNWDGSGTSDLYSIDATTGVPTSIGPTGYAISGLAFDPTDGTLYGAVSVNSDFNPSSLITIDPITGAGTLIGAFGPTLNGTLAFATDGTLYAYDATFGPRLYSIDKATGAATLLGTTPWFSDPIPYAIEVDGSGNVYGFRDAFDGGHFEQVDTSNAHTTGLGTIQNGDEIGLSWFFSGAAFDGSGTMWLTGPDGSVLTLDPSGTLTLIGTLGSLMVVEPGAFDGWAIAWDDEVKPTPWFTFPDFEELFDVAPVADAVSCSTPLGARVSTDGASEGSSCLKIDAATQDSWIQFTPPATPSSTQWVYTSFALYVPSWSDMWDSGAGWDPYVLTLVDAGLGPAYGFYVQPQSSSTGTVEYNYGGGSVADSALFPDGEWVAVEMARVANDGSGNEAVRFWINGTDSGVIASTDGAGAPSNGIIIGDSSWSGPPPADANVRYYLDDFHWSLNGRIGPVDLTAAFFNGIDSGADYDACTGDPVSAHPVDDFYDAFESHTLNVAAPGVMSNDILPTTVSLNTGPSHGTLILNSDGSFSYTPDTGFLGVDTWVYNGNGGTATVTITVSAMTPRAIFDGAVGYKIAQ